MLRPGATPYDFAILDETEDWLVVDKPAPLQIHPSKPADAGHTLWDGLRAMLSFEIVNGGQVSIVNRLDRETSGVVVVAKNAATARRFGKAMMRRQCAKAYLAIVRGWPEWEARTIEAAILRAGRVMDSPIWVRQMVHENGAPCVTEVRVLKRFERCVDRVNQPFALLEARPLTGRMHQIRVHLAHAGFPIVGDKLYSGDGSCYLELMETGWTPALEQKLLLPRQALHSQRMAIEDAEGSLAWEAPLPGSLRAFMREGL
jgi:23S rRNA pseudouridine1911/1915/1917 synthase